MHYLAAASITASAPKEPQKIEFYRILRKPTEMKGDIPIAAILGDTYHLPLSPHDRRCRRWRCCWRTTRSHRVASAMSKQFQIYALPADIERLITHLRGKLNVVLISPASPGPKPTWIDSPIRQTSVLPSEKGTSVRCCLVANGLANIQFKHYPARSAWHVTEDSELISFSGCDFDGGVLVRGRFYCQTDFLNRQGIKDLGFQCATRSGLSVRMVELGEAVGVIAAQSLHGRRIRHGRLSFTSHGRGGGFFAIEQRQGERECAALVELAVNPKPAGLTSD
jgi:hypothetical protein